MASRAIFAIAKPYICLIFLCSFRNFNFFRELLDGDKYNHRYVSSRDQFGLSYITHRTILLKLNTHKVGSDMK